MIKKIVYVLIALIIAHPAFALPEGAQHELTPVVIEQTGDLVIDTSEELPQSIQTKPSTGEIEKNGFQEPYDKSDLKKEVVPTTQNELFRVAILFLKAMAGVLLCSTIIYLLLMHIKKTRYSDNFEQSPYTEQPYQPQQQQKQAHEISGALKTPQDENEALKTFLEQTKDQ